MKIKSNFASVVILVTFFAAHLSAQSDIYSGEGNQRKGMDICTSFDKNGKIKMIKIRPNQINEETQHLVPLDRKIVLTILEELLPSSERGNKVAEFKLNYNRAFGEHIVFEKIQIDLTTVCRGEACGISYAEVRRKERD